MTISCRQIQTRCTAIVLLHLAATCPAAPIQIETEYLTHTIGSDAKNMHFIDRRTGKDYCAREAAIVIARVKKAGKEYLASSIARTEDNLAIRFADIDVTATLKVTSKKHYFILEVVSVSDQTIEEMTFIDSALTLKGTPEESFAGCTLALNLKTNIHAFPGATARLRAMCYARFGFEGAQVAVIGCPADQLRAVMQEVVSEAPDLPHSPIGGPWALDAPINRGSYLFNWGNLSEQTVDDWIKLARQTGMNQIDFHGGADSFRFGDYQLNPKTYPQGMASFKAVIDKLHAADIQAGLHSYAFFIDKSCRWVTPVPDAGLGKDATFTLAADLTPESTAVPVIESTETMSATTGYLMRNSVTLQIDDELITYKDIAKQPPYAFTDCQRGVNGTRAAQHARDAKVHHLKECFGLFVADGESALFEKIAARTAEVFNDCGFDMIYLDALDGEDIIGGVDAGWHYGSKFVFQLSKHLRRPALMEMSTFHHHLWYVRSRFGAWDTPRRGYKSFIDIHLAHNDRYSGTFLPGHLGWWQLMAGTSQQYEPTFPDDIEYLCCKSLAADMGISLLGVDTQSFRNTPAFQRSGEIMQRYESLRHAGTVPPEVKAQLRIPKNEFTLVNNEPQGWAFRPVAYDHHKIEGRSEQSNVWTIANKFGRQPLQLRIETLMSAGSYDAPTNPTLADFQQAADFPVLAEFPDRSSVPGVRASLEASSDQVKIGSTSGRYTASNDTAGRTGTWTKMTKVFSPPLDLKQNQGLGVWIHGDAQGEVLNFQIKSPELLVSGIGEHYVKVDFEGWRYFELIETEGERCADYAWPYSEDMYGLYRQPVFYDQIESLSLWYNNLPAGKTVSCYLSPIKAIPLIETKTVNPSVTIAGETIVFPVSIDTGCYLEFRSLSDCKLYGRKGELISTVEPQGQPPILESGNNRIEFRCEAPSETHARANVTVITQGEQLLPTSRPDR